MTPETLALELKRLAQLSVTHPLLGFPEARLAWLVGEVDRLLPGDEPLTTTYVSGGWKGELRWIGRNRQGIELNSGADYGERCLFIIRVDGLPTQSFGFNHDAFDGVLKAMLLVRDLP